MFVENYADGEPYGEQRPHQLPKRLRIGIITSLPVAFLSFVTGWSFAIEGSLERASICYGIGKLGIAFGLALGLVAWIQRRALRSVKTGPPF